MFSSPVSISASWSTSLVARRRPDVDGAEAELLLADLRHHGLSTSSNGHGRW